MPVRIDGCLPLTLRAERVAERQIRLRIVRIDLECAVRLVDRFVITIDARQHPRIPSFENRLEWVERFDVAQQLDAGVGAPGRDVQHADGDECGAGTLLERERAIQLSFRRWSLLIVRVTSPVDRCSDDNRADRRNLFFARLHPCALESTLHGSHYFSN